MNWFCYLRLACVGALVMAAGAAASRATLTAPDYVEGEVLVQFHAAETWDSAQFTATLHGLEMARRFDWLSAQQGQVMCLLRSPTQTTAALIAELSQDLTVALVEPNYLRWPASMRTPNDPRFGQLWGLQNTGQTVNSSTGTAHADIGFLSAWGLARPSTNEVVVAVIDSGLDLTHPDLVSNLWTNPGEVPNNGLDDDGNGYVDDVHGYDFVFGTGSLVDTNNHGTHVAGTVAATGNNGLGVIGVDFQAKIMALKVLSPNGTNFPTSAIIEATQYAAMMKSRGVNVVAINASFGGGSYNSTESAAIQAAGNVGIVFCAAAGNNTNNNDTVAYYPAGYRLSNMIVIAATDQNDTLATFSDYGATTVDLAAPGVNILSCLPVARFGNTSYVQQASAVYQADPLTYSGLTTSNGITATIYYCGLGNPTDFPAAVNNNIALIQRGTLFFSDKVSNAMAAGARAAVVFNNTNGNFLGTLGTAGNWIPAIALSQADGQALLATLPATGKVVNAPDPANIYQLLNGTSMATPHVAGAVAFAAMNFPSETVAQRIQRILANVTHVAGLAGKVVTGGRLNLARSVDTDGNGLPDWWEQEFFGRLTGTDPNADPDHDRASNLAEFLAGTNPTNFNSALRLTALRAAGTNGVVLEWPGVSGRYYRLLCATNLLNGFNTLVRTNLSATPPLNIVTDAPPASAGPRFYQLELEP